MRLAPSILLLAILACGTLASCNGGADTNPYYDPNWRDKQHPADTTGGGNDDPNPGIEGLGDKTVIPEGALYNGIVLPAIWPPRTYTPSSAKPMDCPYLSTDHPAVAVRGVKARILSSPCELSMAMEPVDEVILPNNSSDEAGSVGL